MSKKYGNILWFLDNCISIGCHSISLSRNKYLSSAVNVLTNSPYISGINMRDISNSISVRVSGKYDKYAAVQISVVFGTL